MSPAALFFMDNGEISKTSAFAWRRHLHGFKIIVIYSNPKQYESIEFCYRESANLFVFKPNCTAELVMILERIFALEWIQN